MSTKETITEEKKNPIVADLRRVCVIIVLCCVLLISFLIIFVDKKIKMTKDISEYIGSNYITVASELEKLGFTTIELRTLEDLSSSYDIKEGTVESILVGETTSFGKGDKFSPDEKIVVSYHTVKKVEAPISSEVIQEYKYIEIAEMFKNADFSNVEVKEVYDLDPDEQGEEYINEVLINNSPYFVESEEYPIDIKVVIICHYPYEKYTVQMHIDFCPNLLFNKYNVDVWVNEEKKYTLTHGEDADCEFRLKKGNNTIVFTSSENKDVHEDITWDVNCDIEAEYTLYCYRNSIELKEEYIDYKIELAENEIKIDASMYDYMGYNYEVVRDELKNLGFENIILKPKYDIYFGITKENSVSEVTIEGRNDFKRGDILSKDAEIIITYHMKEEDNPNKIVENTSMEHEKNTNAESKAKKTQPSEIEKESSLFYSSNDYKTAQNGNTGVFSYRKKGGSYDIYWIIDFDEGYVCLLYN